MENAVAEITRRELTLLLLSCSPLLKAAAAPVVDVAAVDRARILRAANEYLAQGPVTITTSASPRSAGGRHDFFSEGDYWWPDPAHPDGPYVQRDGMTNPDNFVAHRQALMRLSVQVPALVAAWKVTGEAKYGDKAREHFKAWFVTPETRMNPTLQYAQAIHGKTTGRGTGIIDTLHLIEVARAATVLPFAEKAQVKAWFAEYLEWMRTSKNGIEERDAKNNHGTCWVAQAAEFARFTENREVLDWCRERFKTKLIPEQVAPEGSFPLELRRTKPYSYSLFNMDVMGILCQSLLPPSAGSTGENLFRFTLPDGRGMAKVMAFHVPFIADKSKWPYPPDVMYFDQWPVRNPTLLFAGLALERPEYVTIWRKLNADPTVEEAIRNFPVRQPVLWVESAPSRL